MAMSTTAESLTINSILASLGYSDPVAAARQQARMILLGKLAHYQAVVQQLQSKWNCTLEELRERYLAECNEDWQADQDYLEWHWHADAIENIQSQLATLQA
jgi:hypothetical protein